MCTAWSTCCKTGAPLLNCEQLVIYLPCPGENACQNLLMHINIVARRIYFNDGDIFNVDWKPQVQYINYPTATGILYIYLGGIFHDRI